MPITRREFVRTTATGVAAGLAAAAASDAIAARGSGRLKAVAFDAFPVFNPSSVAARAEALFPGHGAALSDEWRLRQFEYCWLRSLSRDYVDFWQVTQDALAFASRKLKLDFDSSQRDSLMSAFIELDPWPDVVPALRSLRTSGLKLAFLSNFTPGMLGANLERGGLATQFEHVLSTHRARTYKPDPRAYELGTESFGLRRDEILFVAHAGWDAAGAKSFGYPTFWVNRSGLPREELGVVPDGAGHDLSDVVRFVDDLATRGARG